MKLQVPFIQLPLVYDAPALRAEIEALGEACWKPHPQGFPGNSMLPLVAVGGDADNEAFAGPMAPTQHLHACPYLQQVLASFGATIGRTRLMRLAGQAEVTRHADQGYYWAERVRIHVPIVTQPTVRFECGDAVVNMAEGECWIFDTWRQHRVLNDAQESRIHLVCDTVGGARFWELVGRGRPHHMPAGDGWRAEPVVLQSGTAALDCERVNVPAVLSPWELESHLAFLLAESVPHPNLAHLQQHAGRLVRAWKALWARHGDSPEGRPQFRETFDAFLSAARPAGQGVMLRNGLHWLAVLQAMIGSVALGAPAARGDAGAQRAMGDNA